MTFIASSGVMSVTFPGAQAGLVVLGVQHTVEVEEEYLLHIGIF